MASRIEYRHGGNPPVAAGLFAVDAKAGKGFSTEVVKRLAWWPAGIDPSLSNIDRVVTELVWKRDDDQAITREQIHELFTQQPQVRMDPVRGAYRRRG